MSLGPFQAEHERIASALSTLSIEEAGLSHKQRRSILEFWVDFDNFILDCLIIEPENYKKELQKLIFSALKKNRLSYKELSEKLTREEEELKKKLEETRSRKAKLISDWEALTAKSVETKSKYISQKPNLPEAEQWKRIFEERMSRLTAAWSSLKAQFL
ncbi:hypothetical protein CDL15_Pgr003168 [Punica granatum]|uniref:Uncharacterized protein n=1 Tax=Punica granatum TaxID=22663 RepID=A0A218X1Y1_PUNGR|nr:hypothetical protein CDL15_Pgr003168 [Punica granatum]PKI42932.1 hypothetical protein CRG98_036730 [Punica granatum]